MARKRQIIVYVCDLYEKLKINYVIYYYYVFSYLILLKNLNINLFISLSMLLTKTITKEETSNWLFLIKINKYVNIISNFINLYVNVVCYMYKGISKIANKFHVFDTRRNTQRKLTT